MRALLLFLSSALILFGCNSSERLDHYHLDGRDGSVYDLPSILPSDVLRDGAFATPNTDAWYSLAEQHHLVGKDIDAVIRCYGQNYLISLLWGRDQPRMYYLLAGTHSWGVCGVIVLNQNLQVTEVRID